MLLEHKTAVIYGGGGAIGGAVARAFAREGAGVYLAGRTRATLDEVAADIIGAGGAADAAEVDATDPEAVGRHLDAVVAERGGVDISFNAISFDVIQGTPLVHLDVSDFVQPITDAMRTQFVTTTAAVRHMTARGSGVILAITATPARMALANVGGFGPACAAIESHCLHLAAEVGPRGVRVVCLRSAGSPDVPGMEVLLEDDSAVPFGYETSFVKLAALRRLPLLAEVGNVAALMASDYAGPMTGTVANLTCGTTLD